MSDRSLIHKLTAPILRLGFHLLYHQLAWTYDTVAAVVSLGSWQAWVRSILPYLDGPRILELGHGPGHLQAVLRKAGRQVIGLDESSQMGKQAYHRLIRSGYQPSLVRGRAQTIPFPDQYFHQVVATFPSEYIADSHTLPEIYRVLVPGGQVVVLLLAWIRGGRTAERATAWLFRVTGEAPSWDDRFLSPLLKYGFNARSERIILKSSELLVILADKASPMDE